MAQQKHCLGILSFALLLTLLLAPAATAAGSGVLNVTSASDIAQGTSHNVSIYVANDYNPKLGNYQFYLYFDPTVVSVTASDVYMDQMSVANVNPTYTDMGAFKFAGGYANGGSSPSRHLFARIHNYRECFSARKLPRMG